MDPQFYFPDMFGTYIHAPVPMNTQSFDLEAFTSQESHNNNPALQVYPSTATITTFPTPSELMVDLALSSQDINDHHQKKNIIHQELCSRTTDNTIVGIPSMGNVGMYEDIDASGPIMPRNNLVQPGFATVEPSRRPKKKATMSTVSATAGSSSTFVPVDSDTITSHEKKRHYLECIEQYILYLHDQFERLGEQPPEMERVASYRGLDNQSIRTLLVHMEHNTRKLSERTREEEERFVSLRNEVHSKGLL